MARVVEHSPVEELGARYRGARDATEARHTQAIRLPTQGRTALEVADVLAFAPRRVERLAARHDALGPGALGDRRRRNGRAAGVPTPAPPAAAPSERLRAPPDDGGRWTGPKAARWMAARLGVERVPRVKAHHDAGLVAERVVARADPEPRREGARRGAADEVPVVADEAVVRLAPEACLRVRHDP